MDCSKDCNYYQFLYCVGLFPRFVFCFKRDIKKCNFSRLFKRSHDLLLPYFSGCKNKRIKQKTNPGSSKMKPFITLVDGLFGKQLNSITKNPISDDPRSTSPLSILQNVCDLFIFSEHIVHVFMAS